MQEPKIPAGMEAAWRDYMDDIDADSDEAARDRYIPDDEDRADEESAHENPDPYEPE